MKPSRKNRFKKNHPVRWARLRVRAAAKVFLATLLLTGTSCGFILAHDYFTQTPHFLARRIMVTGQQRLSRQQVLDIADIGPRTNILSVNLTTTRKRLLAESWIAEATVAREVPSGLRIRIREEVPLAILDMPDGQGFLINTRGEVFSRDDGSAPIDLPHVQGLDHTDLPVAGMLATEAFQEVMGLLRLAAEKNSPLPASGIRRIQMDHGIGATVYTGERNRAVRLGFGHYPEKVKRLGQLMGGLRADPRLAHYRIIDLFDVNRVVITPALADPSSADRKEV
ncbi:MAG: FtsQ-type POTRA domain-containing protein [Desulfosarcina sp.]